MCGNVAARMLKRTSFQQSNGVSPVKGMAEDTDDIVDNIVKKKGCRK